MLALLWNLSTAIRDHLRYYMPTNIAVDTVRSHPRRPWTIPLVVVAVPGYLYVASVTTTLIKRGGPDYLNLLVILFVWDAMKLVWVTALTPAAYIWCTRAGAGTRAE